MKEFETAAGRIAAGIIREFEIPPCLEEIVSDHKVEIQCFPELCGDFRALVGRGGKTFGAITKIVSAVAMNADCLALFWPMIETPGGDIVNERGPYAFNELRTHRFCMDLCRAMFGESSELTFHQTREEDFYALEFGHPESKTKLAKELEPEITHLLRLIFRMHGKRVVINFIPSAHEPEVQPKTSGGRYVGEIER